MTVTNELTNTTVAELSDLIKACRKLRDAMAFAHYAQHGEVLQAYCITEADEVLKRYCVPTAFETLVKYETVPFQHIKEGN